jgi:hypothetical protein
LPVHRSLARLAAFGQLLCLWCLLCAPALAAAAELRVRATDTGAGLAALVESAPWPGLEAATAAALAAALDQAAAAGAVQRGSGPRLALPAAGPRALRVSHPGYRPLLSVLDPAPAGGWTVWLAPVADDAAPAPGDRVHGHVIDPASLMPVAGARVRLAGSGIEATSDADGGFRLDLAGRVPPAADGLRRERLLLRAPDGRQVQRAIALAPGSDLRLVLDLDPAGSDEAGHRHLDARAGSAVQLPVPDPVPSSPALAPLGAGTQPPASIRVGFADAGCTASCCSAASCTHVCVFDLETYVRRGLNDEWIASWNSQSLRAGAVAYRSYGAWHALNPVAGRPWDLCSSACCQVNDGDTSAGTDLAVGRTAGLLLERNGAVFRSEYSAENNCLLGTPSCANVDLSCGNGFAGSPTANWPCLADPVGSGQACFGHGRGMSQWGTQRWSLAPHLRTWRWQVDHYYNDHGAGSGLRTATLGRVLVLSAARPRRRTVAAGQPAWLDYQADNLASTSHGFVLLGASLRRPPGPFVDDPGSDLPVTLPSGSSAVGRPFAVPAGLAPGRYDLYASLYLDIDENGQISSADLAQDLHVAVAAVRVVAAADLIFFDGWQGATP